MKYIEVPQEKIGVNPVQLLQYHLKISNLCIKKNIYIYIYTYMVIWSSAIGETPISYPTIVLNGIMNPYKWRVLIDPTYNC